MRKHRLNIDDDTSEQASLHNLEAKKHKLDSDCDSVEDTAPWVEDCGYRKINSDESSAMSCDEMELNNVPCEGGLRAELPCDGGEVGARDSDPREQLKTVQPRKSTVAGQRRNYVIAKLKVSN